MISLAYRVLWLCVLLATTPASASPVLELVDTGQQVADTAMTWCATSVSETIESVSAGGCQLAPMTPHDIHPGFDHRTFWLRLELFNPQMTAVERWITVGHPRLAYVSLFVPHEGRWLRSDIGNRTPMVMRGRIERNYGALPVSLETHSRRVVWLRVQSDTAVNLATTLWTPAEYLVSGQFNQFWASVGLGGLMITILFALLMLAMTRQWAYGFFALGIMGPLLNASLISGVLQRFLWPVSWPLPTEIIALASLAGVSGYYGFMRTFLPQEARYPKTGRLLKATMVITVSLLLFAILVDYGTVARLWAFSLVSFIATATLLVWQAWRDGDRSAGILLIAFGIFLVLVVVRILFTLGAFTWAPNVVMLAPWGMVLSAPVILLGLISRTRQLQAELSRVQAEHETQLAFFAQLSHELRSPLDTILGNAQLLVRGASFPAGLTNIFASGRHLLSMIDHLLDYARGLSGVIRTVPRPVNMESFLRGMERTARLYAARHDNQFVIHIDEGSLSPDLRILELDTDHLRQVLDNLLNNAARHTQNGVIQLHYRASALTGDRVRLDFTISDTGEGIAESDLQRIFKPFERVSLHSHHQDKGVGLGLAIARQLTECLGGQLTVDSALGRGSKFRFWVLTRALPVDTPAADGGGAGLEAEGYEGRRRVVLVVDDREDNRIILSALLNDLGFTVHPASNGEQAATWLQRTDTLDLIITDQFMPDGDGWMVLQTAEDLHPDVPVILVSAAPPSPPPHWPQTSRFANHFLRPLDHARLLDCISDLLGLAWTTTANHQTPIEAGSIERSAIGRSPTSNTHQPETSPQKPEAADLRVLGHLVETGQVTAIEKWALDLQIRDPQYADYVDRVLSAVRTLDLPELEKLSGPDHPTDSQHESPH